MITAPAGIEFRPMTIPARIDDAGGDDFVEMVRVRNQVYREISGHDDHRIAADELLPAYQSDEHEKRMLWSVVADGRTVGRVGVDLPLEAGSRVAFWLIELVRDAWGQGIGSNAHDLVERVARENGRTILQSWAEHPDAAGPRLAAPTGFGDIPHDHAARFYLRHGYSLEQIERNSALDLLGDLTGLRHLLGEAEAASTDYRLVQWFAPTPPEFVAGYAWMKSRMVTDAPSAGLEFDEETWDPARVARHDAIYVDSGRPLQVTAAQHVGTGELCAFNELVIGKDRTEASHQEDTLVLRDHRGHKLGTLVKCAGLLTWRDFAPDSPRVMTYNAEENRPMLDINEAIGFVPIAYEGAWKKVLDD
jgi:GNAT superfamily N-acetyltransferase